MNAIASLRILAGVSLGLVSFLPLPEVAAQGTSTALTNAASIRSLLPERSAQGLPVRLRGLVTFVFDQESCFVQDDTAGIYVGGERSMGVLVPGDQVEIEGVTGPGDYAPIVRPQIVRRLGRGEFPPAQQVTMDDLLTGREDSQWIEVDGLVRAVSGDPASYQILELATGGGRLSVFVSKSGQANLVDLVDCKVRVRGVCGTWFNRLRQLFGVRLMVPRAEDITVIEPSPPDALALPVQSVSELLRFAPNAPHGRRVKVRATVILHQPRRALFVQEGSFGLYVQTREPGELQPGDLVELLGFPARGDYTPILQDAVWQKIAAGPQPTPNLVQPDEALTGLHDSRLITIEGRLLSRAQNNREATLMLEAGGTVFAAHLEGGKPLLDRLQDGSVLRCTGVCRIEVGEEWRAEPQWRAKSFGVLLRRPEDVEVVALPPWWNLKRLFWVVGILTAVVVASLTWAGLLRRKVGQQTTIIRQQLEAEARLKERYQDLFENATDMVYTHDLSGRITSINMAGERLLGYDRIALTEGWLTDFVVEEQRQAATRWLEQIVDGNAPATVEWDFRAASGGRVRLEISTRLIDREGKRVEVEGIARDVSERRRMEKEILEISTREQRRIGHDLHDGVCQRLAGIAFLADILADKLDAQALPEGADAHKITELVNHTNGQTRGVARGLFPVRLEQNGLVSALEELAADSGAFFKTTCEFGCEAPVAISDQSMAEHLYYIAQEAVNNAAKHGRARNIKIRLMAAENQGCVLTIRDDGAGLTPGTQWSKGMGIRIMNYRAKMIGADIQIGSGPGGGTEVVCRVLGDARAGH